MKELTKGEEQVMQILWKLKKAFVKDIIDEMPPDENGEKPAYNTVSTFIRLLESKGFVGHTAYGKTYEYFPLIEKQLYSNFYLKSFLGRFFSGSFEQMVSAFAKQNDISVQEMEKLAKELDKNTEK